MPTKPPARSPADQLLGEIETRIVGMQHFDAAALPGEPVRLLREPENRHDPCAILVENDRSEPIGHLPRRLVCWLAHLIDAAEVRIDACVPTAASPDARYRGSLPVTLTVFLSPKGKRLISPRTVVNNLDALHELVRRTYEDAPGYNDPALVDGLVEGLRPFARQELLPETRLLLSMLPGIAREKRLAQAIQGMAQLRQVVAALHVGAPCHHENLTIFPLIWPDPSDPAYTLLEPAIEAGTAVVEETSASGDVPNLAVTNTGDLPVLIPEGEILVGAKQNRVVNVTVLVAARSRFTLPVSCVEQGRWQHDGRQFRGRYAAPPSLRSRKLQSVERNRRACGEARSDQGQVWDDVAACLSQLGVESPTASLADGYAAAEGPLRERRERFALPADAAGLLVARHGRIVGLDLFGSPQIFAPIRQRLLDAYLLDSLNDRRPSPQAEPAQARQFLDRVAARAKPRMPPLGEGIELEIQADDFLGCALLYGGRLCHLAVFSNVMG